MTTLRYIFLSWLVAWIGLATPFAFGEEHSLLVRYLDYPALTERLQALAQNERVTYRSLARTAAGHDLHQLTLGGKDADQRPAILIVGGIEPRLPMSTEIAVRLAEGLGKENDLLQRATFYFIPCINPDGAVRLRTAPYRDSVGNGRPTDDDRDGSMGEDPPDDLDSDGYITSMRVYRSGGAYRPDENDPRLDAPADAPAGKPGVYDLFTEGMDNDHDESWNEDASDGVDLNRNFTFRYQPFTQNSGEHAISEIESRALADFCWDHPNIVLIVTLSHQDNLHQPWTVQPGGGGGGSIITTVDAKDVPYYANLSQRYRQRVKLDNPPPPSSPNGDFLHWSYFHFGRWSIGTPGWTIPKVEGLNAEGQSEATKSEEGGSDELPPESTEPNEPVDPHSVEATPIAGQAIPGGPPGGQRGSGRRRPPDGAVRGRPPIGRPPGRGAGSSEGDRGSSNGSRNLELDRQALKWMEQQGIVGFSERKMIEHPDFAGHNVEVGGFRNLWRNNPPAAQLDEIASQHLAYIIEVCGLLPALKIENVRKEPLGHGVFRLTARVVNRGHLPTSTNLGGNNRLTYPVQVELQLPDKVTLISQPRRHRVTIIEGGGAATEQSWLIRASDPPVETVTIRAHSIMAGSNEVQVVLAGDS